jgi:hypothetical protein
MASNETGQVILRRRLTVSGSEAGIPLDKGASSGGRKGNDLGRVAGLHL